MANTTIFRLRFNRSYTVFVKTGHGHVTVNFVPIVISGRTENSQFSTADKEVIEALKKHEHYGSLFYMEEDGQEVSAKPAKVAPAAGSKQPIVARAATVPAVKTPGSGDSSSPEETEAGAGGLGDGAEHPNPEEETEKSEANEGEDSSEANAATGEPGDGGSDGLTHDKGVTSKNKAIAFLLEKYNATFAQTADIPAMKEEARTVYSLVFDNWN